jgi:hypothetical protein
MLHRYAQKSGCRPESERTFIVGKALTRSQALELADFFVGACRPAGLPVIAFQLACSLRKARINRNARNTDRSISRDVSNRGPGIGSTNTDISGKAIFEIGYDSPNTGAIEYTRVHQALA